MARSFADQHVLCTEAAEALDRSADQERMSVDVVSGDVIDEVGLNEDSLPTKVQVKKLQPGMQNTFQVVRIGFGPENRHPGAGLPPSYVVLGTVQQGASGGAGSQAERGCQECPSITFHEPREIRFPLREDGARAKRRQESHNR